MYWRLITVNFEICQGFYGFQFFGGGEKKERNNQAASATESNKPFMLHSITKNICIQWPIY